MAPRNEHPKWGGRKKKTSDPPPSPNPTTAPEVPRKYSPPTFINREVALQHIAARLPLVSAKLRMEIIDKWKPVEFLGQLLTRGWVKMENDDGSSYTLRFDPKSILRAAEILAKLSLPQVLPLSPPPETTPPSELSAEDISRILKQATDLAETIRNGKSHPGNVGSDFSEFQEIAETETGKV